MSDTGIGARVQRKEDRRFITGKANYTDDINLKNQTYGYFVRSPHAHAAILSIDTSKAQNRTGRARACSRARIWRQTRSAG